MSTENEVPQKASFGRRLLTAFKRLFIFLFRVLLTLFIIGAIGAAIYLGAPVLIDEYLLKDVKINTEQIQDINAEFEANTEFWSQRLADLQNRIETLEIQSDNDKQTIDSLKTQLTETNALIQSQKSSLDQLEVLQLSLDEYGEMLSSFEEQVALHEGDLEEIQGKLSTLNQSVEGNQEELAELSAQLEAQPQIGTLRQELELLKVMELITRARVSIGQNNIGLATDDLLAAQDLLASLSTELPAYQAKYLSNIVQRLELATENLTSSTDLVDEDLEVAWQLLLQQLPDEASEDELTPTPSSTQEEGETPTPTPQP
jgi:uncharacterized coiled-coil protein SlyX